MNDAGRLGVGVGRVGAVRGPSVLPPPPLSRLFLSVRWSLFYLIHEDKAGAPITAGPPAEVLAHLNLLAGGLFVCSMSKKKPKS